MARVRRGQFFDAALLLVGLVLSGVVIGPWLRDPGGLTAAGWFVPAVVVLLAQFPLELPGRAGEVVIGFEAAALVYLSLQSPPGAAVATWLVATVLAHVVFTKKSWMTRAFNVGCTTVSGVVLALYVAPGRDSSPLRQMTAVAVGCAAYFVVDIVLTSASLALIEQQPLWVALPGKRTLLPLGVFVGIDSLGYLAALLDRAYPAAALLLLVVPLATIVVAARAVTRSRESERRAAGLFALARAAAADESAGDVTNLLVERLADLLPLRDVAIRREQPDPGVLSEPLTVDGEERWVVVSHGRGHVSFAEEEREILATLAAVAADSLERQRLVAEMTRMARYDPLTGLANRTMFNDRLSQAIARSRRTRRHVAVLYCDLDGFKGVNDRFGHLVGDQVLATAAEQLVATLRVSDTPARLGGDEFAILAEDLTGPEEAVAVGERIVRAFERPLSVMNQPVRLGVSVGVAASRGDVDAQTLLRSADMAMYRAKAFGKNRVEFFDPQMQQQSERRMRLEDELRTAIEKGTLSLAPQPVVDLETGTVESFEALLRWHHPALGEIPPDVLLPVAEQIGVMTRLGRWVLREAHRQGVVLSEFSGRRVTMAVNVAAEQLHDEQFLDHVARLADDPRVRLVLELTEGALVEEHMAVPTLTRLHDAGVGIAIDDFGVGYSSISYLHRFSCIDVVKIDRTFVREVATDPRTRALVESVVAMANAFDAVVVAEGIEDEESRTALREAGCRLGQGFLFSPPVHLTRAAQFLEGTLPREPVAPVVPLLRRSRRKSG